MDGFGVELRIRRFNAGLALRDLEELTGISNAFLCQLENRDNKGFGFEVAILLSEALGWDLKEMAAEFMDDRGKLE